MHKSIFFMNETNANPSTLTVTFYCLFADDFQLNIELVDTNQVQGLQDAWLKAFEQYCPNNVPKMQKQLKRKLGSIYNFDDLSNIVMRFINTNGKRDEIRLTTNYAMVG